MPCYTPINAYVAPGKTENGKKVIVFKRPETIMEEIQLPCGQCIGCRLLRSVSWAARCMHEIQLHDQNCFITLTYDDENLPSDYSLRKEDFQKFLKRLRKDISPRKIRYFMCGEYGDESWRPHYHAIIFNYAFPDKQRVQIKEVENPTYISTQLSRLWTHGNHLIDEANFNTAAYIARYCTKKITGEKAESHYSRTILDWNEFTGEINHWQEVELTPEYATMSKKPAIGKDWFEKYKNDCYPSDFLIVDGRKVPIPRYYDKLMELEDEYVIRLQKEERKQQALENADDNTFYRLYQRQIAKEAQTASLRRNKI